MNLEGWESGGTIKYKRKLGGRMYLQAGERGGLFSIDVGRQQEIQVYTPRCAGRHGPELEGRGGLGELDGDPGLTGFSEARESGKFREWMKFLMRAGRE